MEYTDEKYRPKTLNEINQINIDTVKTQALNMCHEISFSKDSLITKYNYLFTKVPSLFNKIIRDINDDKNKTSRPNKDGVNTPFVFNKSDFQVNLNFILQQLSDIQNKHNKNDDIDTHKIISDKFNEQYIPSKFLDKK